MMDAYKISDNFQRTEGCKMISPHHSHPTNGVRPSDVKWGGAQNDPHIIITEKVRVNKKEE